MPKTNKLPKRMRDSLEFSATQPKAHCRCGHTGDGERGWHLGYNGHGACMACPCHQFSWKAWTMAYHKYMEARGHKVRGL